MLRSSTAARTVPVLRERRVIALPGSARLEAFFGTEAGRTFEVWQAQDGRGGALDHLADQERIRGIHGRALVGGEIGCSLSHLSLYRHFAEQPGKDRDVIAIAEDDALVSSDFEPVVSRLLASGADFDVVLLSYNAVSAEETDFFDLYEDNVPLSLIGPRLGRSARGRTYRVGRPEGMIIGTGLYLITREACRRIVAEFDRTGLLYWMADEWRWFRDHLGVKVLMLRPTLASWSDTTVIHGRPQATEDIANNLTALPQGFRARLAPRRRLLRLLRVGKATGRDALIRLRNPSGDRTRGV